MMLTEYAIINALLLEKVKEKNPHFFNDKLLDALGKQEFTIFFELDKFHGDLCCLRVKFLEREYDDVTYYIGDDFTLHTRITKMNDPSEINL